MDRRPLHRVTVVLAVLVLFAALSGCTTLVEGHPQPLAQPITDVPDSQLPITGASSDAIDTQASNALADLQDYWSSQFPDVFNKDFTPLKGGYFSVDPNNIDPAQYPNGVGCGTAPRDVENNAFYCEAPNTPNSDSISYDRAFLGELADQFGEFIPDLVMAHEFGHAVQARTDSPRASIAVETQADCYAGAWTAWVAAGKAQHTSIRRSDLDQLLRGYLKLRDPVGTSSAAQQAHGSAFDRVSGFQEGFDSGPTACRDNFGPDRVFTQGTFTDADIDTRGNAPYEQLQGLMSEAFPTFWQQVFSSAFGKQFTTPTLEPFQAKRPDCEKQELQLVFCSQGPLVAYDETLTHKVYDDIGDYAVVTAVSIPYGLAARDQLGLSAHDGAAYRSSVCLSGWFSAQVFNGQVGTVQISPGDLDEAVQFLLQYANDPKVLPGVDRSGFQLVDLFRQGFLQGGKPCDIGL